MIYKVEKYISKHRLLDKERYVLVALSGGADSVALLLALLKLGYRCEAVHCNFHLRGEESDRDESFVERLCQRHNVPLHKVSFETTEYAREKGISIEMAARELRYSIFEKIRKETGAGAIAVAHHKDDSAETLLLNLLRGTGIKGLRGIQPRNGHVVRPMLCVGRNDIIEYLKWRGEEFVTDSTNLTSDYTRNKIRLEVIPKLAEINPSIKESLAATAQRIGEAEKIYRNAVDEAIKRVKKGDSIDISQLKKEVSPTTLLHEMLSPLGFNSTQADEIAASLGSDGSKIFHSNAWSIVKDRDKLLITERRDVETICTALPEEGITETAHGTITTEIADYSGTIEKQRHIATLDIEKLKMPLILRNVHAGDRFAPFGMRGTKLVSDYLTDRKKSIIEKQEQLVVTDAEGEIVWLVDERPSSHCCIGGNTKKILRITWRRNV